MKKLNIFVTALIASATLTITSCKKQPISCFTASSSFVEVNETVTFSDCSTDAVNYEWNFGDGTSSSIKNPTHSYNSAGTYIVELKTFSKKDKKKDVTISTITVTEPITNIVVDPCEGVTCLNGGTCANGLCNCPEGYSGSDCSIQKTPSKIIIKKITVTKFPATDGGAGWDLTSGADIYPVIKKGSTEIWNSSTYKSDANPNSSYNFTPSSNIELTSPNEAYTILLYDYDTADADDYMDLAVFYPYSSTGGFPSTLTVENTSGDVGFVLTLSYVW